MISFPLYDNLISKVPKKDLTAKQKEEFINNFKIIDMNGQELIYLLIYIYHSQNEKSTNSLPYNGIKENTDKNSICNVTWNFNNFPPKLRQLVHHFIELHIKTIKEDGNRNNLN